MRYLLLLLALAGCADKPPEPAQVCMVAGQNYMNAKRIAFSSVRWSGAATNLGWEGTVVFYGPNDERRAAFRCEVTGANDAHLTGPLP